MGWSVVSFANDSRPFSPSALPDTSRSQVSRSQRRVIQVIGPTMLRACNLQKPQLELATTESLTIQGLTCPRVLLPGGRRVTATGYKVADVDPDPIAAVHGIGPNVHVTIFFAKQLAISGPWIERRYEFN